MGTLMCFTQINMPLILKHHSILWARPFPKTVHYTATHAFQTLEIFILYVDLKRDCVFSLILLEGSGPAVVRTRPASFQAWDS